MEKTERSKYRVTLQEVTINTEGEEQTRAYVRLTLAGRREQAERVGPSAENAVLLSVALATLDAIKGLLPRPLDLRIEYVKQVTPRPGSPPTILSLIRLHQAGKETLLNGSCPVLDSMHKAAARSVLDSLNRTIEYMLEQHERREQIGDRSSKLERAAIGLMDAPVAVNARVPEPSIEPAATAVAPAATLLPSEVEIATAALDAERAEYLFAQGQAAAMKGNYEQAISFYEQAIVLTPENARYHYSLGSALSKLPDRIKEAESALSRTIALSPTTAAYHTELGLLYKEMGLAEKAHTKFQEALALDGNDTRAMRETEALRENLEASKPPRTTGALPRANGTGALRKAGTEPAPSIWNIKVRPKIAIIAAAVILVCVGGVLFFFLLGGAPSRLPEPMLELPSMRALKIVYDSPSVEPGKTVLQKADQIIKERKLGASSNGHWLVMAGQKPGQFWVYLSLQDLQKKPQRAHWIVDVEKKQVLPANAAAESISGKVQP